MWRVESCDPHCGSVSYIREPPHLVQVAPPLGRASRGSPDTRRILFPEIQRQAVPWYWGCEGAWFSPLPPRVGQA